VEKKSKAFEETEDDQSNYDISIHLPNSKLMFHLFEVVRKLMAVEV
jgi:hypothetical protein